MNLILNHLRTSPAPSINPSRPLLPFGSTPPNMLPLNPILYLTLAIDSVAPLMRIRNQRGAAGGGVALQIPAPLGEKQRRRTVLKWILDAAEKKQSGGGKGALAKKIADEIVSIAEGRSQVWNKRDLVHKMGVSARANVKWAMMQKR
jgi:small subunit ribosomal protein S7